MFLIKIKMLSLVIGNTKPKAPDPVRTHKLSGLRHGRY